MADDRTLLRELAQAYAEIASDPVQETRRDLWRRHNSRQRTRPPVYVRAFAWREIGASLCLCRDPFLRRWEDWLRRHLFWASLGDDWVFEPWVPLPAVKMTPPGGLWGLPIRWIGRGHDTAGICDSPLRTPEDIDRLVMPTHRIDEDATRRAAERLTEAIGDILPVVVDRTPAYINFSGDISTHLAQLRGIEQIFWDMMDRPDWLHRLLAFLRDGVLAVHRQAEEAGDWSLLSHYNQSVPYSLELRDPAPDSGPVPRGDLWCFCAAQEFSGVGPAMFDEFMLQYQVPIMEAFGLSAYGCCEDLTAKLDVLRRIPNLRRIAVSPMADVRRCAEQIGDTYILSYRPSPSDMVGYSWSPERVRRVLWEDLIACRENGCHVDITLKDVETVQGEAERPGRWVCIAREIIDKVFG
ncbi:MAG: hypothetical protein JXR77_12720 [Lentisphaeria bacterium]|nr:hypothetical protein [Lentisphaeria bacterium]